MRLDRLQSAALLPAFMDCQQGVMTPNDLKVSWISTSQVNVAAGWALIPDLLDTYISGAALVPSRAPNLTTVTGIPAAGANPRIDQIILTLPGYVGGAPGVTRVAGIETAAATLDSLTARVSDATLNSTYPQGWVRMADVLVGTGGVAGASSIRDRRTYARGFNHRVSTTSATGAGATATNLVAATSMLSGAVDFRLESLGLNPVTITFTSRLNMSSSTSYWALLYEGTSGLREMDFQKSGLISMQYIALPFAGTHLYNWKHYSAAGSALLDPYSNPGTDPDGPAQLIVREHVTGGSGSNGTT